MECVVSALKPSLRGEMASAYIIPSHHAVCEEENWPYGGLTSGPKTTAVAAGDDFSVDDLLDFSNGELDDGSLLEVDEKESLSDGVNDDCNSNSSSRSCTGFSDDSDSILEGGLAVPDDDIAQLEWVSHFVDDSVYEIPLLYPTTKWQQEKNANDVDENRLQPPCFLCPVPVKSRSKRPRIARQSISSQLSESSSSSSSTSSCLLTKKIKMKTNYGDQTGSVLFQRRCSHCGVQKTPQWRTGPQGAKTLCNACGVRYKSGRLFPEYRPACSPSFSVDIHSNSHRKVLEMRRKKEIGSGEGEMNLMVTGY